MFLSAYPDPLQEAERLEKLAGFEIIDTPHEQEFDTIVLLAQRLLDVPIALVSLVDDHRQWFKARCGLDATETPRDMAFCAHAMHVPDVMIVEDAALDPRFALNPLVTGAPHVRFYAGVPLRPSAEGFGDDLPGIGTLCVLDTSPRRFSEEETHLLRQLAGLVSALIRARASAAKANRLSDQAQRHADLLERQQVQLHQAEQMAGIGSWRFEVADNSVHWSDQVHAIHGLPTGKMPALDAALNHYPPERRAEVARLVQRGVTHAESFDFESDFVTADGRLRRVRSVGQPQLTGGKVAALIGVFQDVTDRHARELVLRKTADTDALTGLPNRACFEARLAEAVACGQARGEPACLLLLDLDGFKGVNDTFGHAAGDEVLRIVADRLRRLAYDTAFVARLGGDEFVMLVTRPRDCARIEQVIGKTLAALRHSVDRDGQCRSVSATIGCARLDAAITAPSEWTRRADIALYEAKRSRRGTACIFGESVQAPRLAA